MEDIIVKRVAQPKLNDPIFIEGLPGIGNVGKLAADHLVEELKADKFAEMYSKYFPPQVLINDDGIVRLVSNDFYYRKAKKKNQRDLILMVGDYQGLTPEGQYELCNRMLDIIEEFKTKRLITLGGYGLGRIVDEPRVFGAATDKESVDEMKKYGVVFKSGEPSGGIVGAGGLLLGLSMLRGMSGVCLMSETSGYFVDPKSARVLLTVLTKVLNIEVDMELLTKKAVQIDKINAQLKEMERKFTPPETPPEDLKYIG
jgi:hypothetical protein